MELFDVRRETFAMVEEFSAIVTLETLFRREFVHPLNVTPVGAHMTKSFVAAETLDALCPLLKRML